MSPSSSTVSALLETRDDVTIDPLSSTSQQQQQQRQQQQQQQQQQQRQPQMIMSSHTEVLETMIRQETLRQLHYAWEAQRKLAQRCIDNGDGGGEDVVSSFRGAEGRVRFTGESVDAVCDEVDSKEEAKSMDVADDFKGEERRSLRSDSDRKEKDKKDETGVNKCTGTNIL